MVVRGGRGRKRHEDKQIKATDPPHNEDRSDAVRKRQQDGERRRGRRLDQSHSQSKASSPWTQTDRQTDREPTVSLNMTAHLIHGPMQGDGLRFPPSHFILCVPEGEAKSAVI